MEFLPLYLINEWGKTVVETLDLLFLLVANSMDPGVDVYVQWSQQALVDGHSCNRCCTDSPIADLRDGIGSQGQATEASCRCAQSCTAVALGPQTHGCAVWRFSPLQRRKRSGCSWALMCNSLSLGYLLYRQLWVWCDSEVMWLPNVGKPVCWMTPALPPTPTVKVA